MSTANIQVRIDADLKRATEDALKSMGLSMSSAINLFCHQVVNQKCIPFNIVMPPVPNAATKKAMDDTLTGKGLSRTFDTVDEMWHDLNA
jgi:DNA-damage-inducible protein J